MKVAILIPTLNRPSFIKRMVKYYDSLNSPHPIYIGDASNIEISRDILSFLKNIINVKVNYFHWEKLSIEKTVMKLAKEAAVECEYCAQHGDEDYFIPSSLTKCAIFLSENPDYRTVQGRAALVAMDSPDAIGNIKGINIYWEKPSLEDLTKMERLMFFHKNYYVTEFSVSRVNAYIFDSLSYSTTVDTEIHELVHCYTMAINGKSKFIDCLYLIRLRHAGLLTHGDGQKELSNRKTFSQDYNNMIDSLSRTLSDDKDISYTEAKKLVQVLMLEKMKRSLTIEKRSNIKLKNIFQLLKDILLDKCGLRPLRERFRVKNSMELLIAKHARFHSDFLPVKKSLTDKEL